VLAGGDVPVAAYLSIHNMVAGVVDRHGSPAQRARYLPRLASMQALASYCLTEPGAGSDAAALRTSAARAPGGGYMLNGAKAFISGAGASDLYLVMARTGGADSGHRGISAFLVEKARALGLPHARLPLARRAAAQSALPLPLPRAMLTPRACTPQNPSARARARRARRG
jgi:alkylation response protein AidB-like acyl-CoA dehydrogenase